jgi:hypothetical protein
MLPLHVALTSKGGALAVDAVLEVAQRVGPTEDEVTDTGDVVSVGVAADAVLMGV